MKTTRIPRASRLLPVLAFGVLIGSVFTVRVRAAGPDLPFSSGSTGADGALTFREIPVGRSSAGMAYDSVRQEVVLFGGFVGNWLGDTWTWSGVNWIRKLPATSPMNRSGHGMVWDAARSEIVLFGGNFNSIRLNDTWTWNGTTWTQKSPANSPTPRDYFCMAYDAARQQVVLFGGNSGGQETWLWDGTNWTQASPVNSPPPTGSSALAYDAARQKCVYFGNYGQTWTWNGTNWNFETPFVSPSPRSYPAMAFDPVRNVVVLFSGNNVADTWFWNGTNWSPASPAVTPQGRQTHTLVWDATRQRAVMFGGDVPGVDSYSADTWLWDGTTWQFWSGKSQTFDMTADADGVWNFTTINIPPNVTVRFKKNAANTPVRWLATGDVTIDGALDVNGDTGSNLLPPGVSASGGPGGYDGGRGGIAFISSASYVGVPGQGPGGGAPGTAQQTSPTNLRDGIGGNYTGSYGNVFLQPLLGGSGGGGGASSDTLNGGNGGGGGGAILISSSRDIMLNGLIRANGGNYEYSGASYGGRGSGGGILLRADRVTGPGSLQAYGGDSGVPNGRIRIEGYSRTLTGGRVPPEVVGLPAVNAEINQIGALTIVSVKGVTVASPPSGNLLTPDVVFSDTGPVTIVVSGSGIPNGTPVKLRITTAASVIEPPPQNLAGGTATFNVTVPKGVGTLQATATFSAP